MKINISHNVYFVKTILFVIMIITYQINISAQSFEKLYPSFNPGFIIESFPGGKEQFLIGNCLWEFKSNAHNVNFKLFDIYGGGRFGAGHLPETVGKFCFLSGNYWVQKNNSNEKMPSITQYKFGLNMANGDFSGLFKEDVDIITLKMEMFLNPIAAENSYKTPNKYVIPGYWGGFYLEPGFFQVDNDSNMLIGKDSAKIIGLGYRLGLSSGINLRNNCTFKIESSIRQILGDVNFKEIKLSAKFTKEFYYTYVDKQWHDTTTKALELFALAKFNYSEFNKGIYRIPSIGVGINFYNYIEYINVWEVLKKFN